MLFDNPRVETDDYYPAGVNTNHQLKIPEFITRDQIAGKPRINDPAPGRYETDPKNGYGTRTGVLNSDTTC